MRVEGGGGAGLHGTLSENLRTVIGVNEYLNGQNYFQRKGQLTDDGVGAEKV